MAEHLKTDTQVNNSSVASGVSRRKLIRAGLSAAPVMAGLKSQSALATNGICTPSIWCSIKAANFCISGAATPPQQNYCKHHSWWSGSGHAACATYYHGANNNCAGYAGSHFTMARNFKDVCLTANNSSFQTSKSKLGRHCAAMHLNYTVYPSTCPIDTTTCKAIWAGCKDGGTWTPVSGGNAWTQQDCLDYFDYVCGQKPLVCV